MAKGAAPSQDQLLELMKRAAGELKHAQDEARALADELKHAKDEARTAVQALQKEQAAHEKTELELEQALKAAKNAKGQAGTDEELLKDQIEAERENGKALAERVKELEAALDGSAAELKAKLNESETALSIAVQQEQAKGEKEMEEQRGLLDDAAGKLVEQEQQLNQEKDKHQLTAQKLLESRSKARELELTVASEQERVKGLEAAAQQLADAHEKALREAAEAAQKSTADVRQSFAAASQELAQVSERWREVERQYEALHREMLLTLEQRDEARRQLENERAERERLTRVLQGQHR